jgi:ribonuclease HII
VFSEADFILGFDEVGRGSVAGPVTVGLLALPVFWPQLTQIAGGNYTQYRPFAMVRDSKQLTPLKRLLVADLVSSDKFESLVLSADNKLIDQFGIGVCLSHLLRLGYASLRSSLPQKSRELMIADGKIKLLAKLDLVLTERLMAQNPNLKISNLNLENQVIHRENFADDKYLSVALASNLAKTARDDHMLVLDKLHPQFNWAQNKGYATSKHIQAILRNPENEYLRQTFLTRLVQPVSLFDSTKY